MYKVYKIAWSGLKFEVAHFNTKQEATEFINAHKDYNLIVE